MHRSPRVHLAPLLALATALASVVLPTPLAALDEGRLEPSWFGPDSAPLEFREAEEIDYLWVRPGFSLDGRKVRFAPWSEPVFLGEAAGKRDAKDQRLATQITSTVHEVFADAFRAAWSGRISIVDSGEEIRAEGRVVDCSTGATAAKVLVGFGAGAGNTTFDWKLVDAKTGELLLAIHHRSVSGTSWSTTDSKLANWVEEMAEEAADSGFEKLYAKGKRARE
jgi:hypothetical protein